MFISQFHEFICENLLMALTHFLEGVQGLLILSVASQFGGIWHLHKAHKGAYLLRADLRHTIDLLRSGEFFYPFLIFLLGHKSPAVMSKFHSVRMPQQAWSQSGKQVGTWVGGSWCFSRTLPGVLSGTSLLLIRKDDEQSLGLPSSPPRWRRCPHPDALQHGEPSATWFFSMAPPATGHHSQPGFIPPLPLQRQPQRTGVESVNRSLSYGRASTYMSSHLSHSL